MAHYSGAFSGLTPLIQVRTIKNVKLCQLQQGEQCS